MKPLLIYYQIQMNKILLTAAIAATLLTIPAFIQAEDASMTYPAASCEVSC